MFWPPRVAGRRGPRNDCEQALSRSLKRSAENRNSTPMSRRKFIGLSRHPRVVLLFALLAGLLATAGFPSIAHAQRNSNTGSINLNAVLSTSLTVSAAPGLVNFALVRNGVANGSSTINITTTWILGQGANSVTIWAYFSSVASALSDGVGDNIPSSGVSGSPNGGAFTTFTGASPFAAGSSLQIFSVDVSNGNNTGNTVTGTHPDTLNLRIDTTGLNLPAGTYTGTLNIRAQAL